VLLKTIVWEKLGSYLFHEDIIGVVGEDGVGDVIGGATQVVLLGYRLAQVELRAQLLVALVVLQLLAHDSVTEHGVHAAVVKTWKIKVSTQRRKFFLLLKCKKLLSL
jgi:hypothetical protein